jgi:mannose-6-phosphate isomerase
MSALEYDERPWGNYTVLSDEDDHKVKRIVVHPGKRLSYQTHARRAEHWYVVSGTATVTLDGLDREVGPGQAVDIARGMAHRCANQGTEDVVFIEVQRGDYFGEDDIVRLEDDFGRS